MLCPGNVTIRVEFNDTTPPLVRSRMQLSLSHCVSWQAEPVNRFLAEKVVLPMWRPMIIAWTPPVLGVLGKFLQSATDAF